jgi:8-oxo-dGTP pyrophosphatase MutT (NUDIX family)
MGALRGSDGGFLLGVMGQHTANPGHIYFPAGTPDCDDIVETPAGPVVDVLGNVRREVAEETGLTGRDFTEAAGWRAVLYGQRFALMKIMDLAEPAEAVRRRVLEFLKRDANPELADIRIVRGIDDLDPLMPGFVTAFLADIWK